MCFYKKINDDEIRSRTDLVENERPTEENLHTLFLLRQINTHTTTQVTERESEREEEREREQLVNVSRNLVAA